MSDFITIYTDASYKRGKASWAFYSVYKRSRYTDAGPCQKTFRNNHEAEMYAIYMAIVKALKRWPDAEGVFINTDSLVCCHFWWPFWRDPGLEGVEGVANIRDKAYEVLGNRWIRVKHVRGHWKDPKEIRAYLNNQVDKMARKYL